MWGCRACHVLRCRGWFYTQRRALWSESEICVVCHLSFIRPQPSAVLSQAIDFCGSLGVREKGGGVSECGGNICFKATRGPGLCVWPCVSKLGWGSLPWTTRRPWHKQEEVMLKHSPFAFRKRAVLLTLNQTSHSSQISIHRHNT